MVCTTYLEMTSKAQWIRRDRSRTTLDIRECVVKQPRLNRFLYEYVGADWNWVYRLPWSLEQWRAYVTAENVRTFVALREASIAGYYELRRGGEGVEIRSLGLTPEFIGHGYGGLLLDHAVETGLDAGVNRVWLHTCTFDHPGALGFYLRSGFVAYERKIEMVPDPRLDGTLPRDAAPHVPIIEGDRS